MMLITPSIIEITITFAIMINKILVFFFLMPYLFHNVSLLLAFSCWSYPDLLLLLLDLIPYAPHDFQISWFFRVDLNLLTDMTNMHCHCIINTHRIFIPDIFIYLVNRKYFALMLYKQQQKCCTQSG